MSKKKQKLLQKYLDKKAKQKSRDRILEEIISLDNKRKIEIENEKNIIKNTIDKKKKRKIKKTEKNPKEAFCTKKIKTNLLDENKQEAKNLIFYNNLDINENETQEAIEENISNQKIFTENINNQKIITENLSDQNIITKNHCNQKSITENLSNQKIITDDSINQKIIIDNFNNQKIVTENLSNLIEINKDLACNKLEFSENINNIVLLDNAKNELNLNLDNNFTSNLHEKVTEKEHFSANNCTITNNFFLNRSKEIEEERRKLPIYYEESNIISLIRQHNVTIIHSETGSGKSTQIPQFLLENGFCSSKIIGMTQPRRLAAISISKRINRELNKNISGYKIKYEDTTNKETKIKIMTDGVLLNEMKNDFLLKKYSVIIIDEIHEKNMNMEILIPLLSKIVEMRNKNKDFLKVIFMSATLETKKLQDYFTNKIGIFQMFDKNYKVNIMYENKTDVNYIDLCIEKIKKILKLDEYEEKHNFNALKLKTHDKENKDILPKNVKNNKDSSILVFLPSKDDIYQLRNKIINEKIEVEPLVLHSSLSYKEQLLVYKKYEKRKVILATNIAETSLTIPDVVFVIDTGRMKYKIVRDINSFSFKIDFISKANAKQRAGRAGRNSSGVCYRLYSGAVYESFNDNTIPEIQRSSLEEIVLFLKSLGITNLLKFPFLNIPEIEKLSEAIKFLKNLDALDEEENITDLGTKMSILPVNPRLSRILLLDSNFEKEITLAASILSLNFEFDFTKDNLEYFSNCKSDILAKMRMVIDYFKEKNKKEFCSKWNVSQKQLEEIIKVYFYLFKAKGIEMKFFVDDLDEKSCLELRKIIFCGYCQNLAVKIGNEYFYNSEKVFLSKQSINCEEKFVVFQNLVYGTNRIFMKNITLIENEWLKK